jgi:hypothetical protein
MTCISCLIYALESNPAYIKRPLAPEIQSQVSALYVSDQVLKLAETFNLRPPCFFFRLAIQIILTLPQTIDFMMRVVFATAPLRYLIRKFLPLRFRRLVLNTIFISRSISNHGTVIFHILLCPHRSRFCYIINGASWSVQTQIFMLF